MNHINKILVQENLKLIYKEIIWTKTKIIKNEFKIFSDFEKWKAIWVKGRYLEKFENKINKILNIVGLKITMDGK
jgi:hypothetical protein